MVKKVKPAIKNRQLDSNFLRKSEKTKFGGAGEGGVFRDKETGKDYLVKRVASSASNWRSWDEVLAAKILRTAGVEVPNMFAVTDAKGQVYVASKIIPKVRNCDAKTFKSLPKAVKNRILSSHILHCWIGNRDLVNVAGDNFVIDSDSRVFNVDLGASLFSGFRSVIYGPDGANFNSHQIQNLLLEHQSQAFGNLFKADGSTIEAKNKKQVLEFFSDLFESPEAEQSYALQGTLMLAKFSDNDIQEIVNNTGHTPVDKASRIQVLIARRDTLIAYMIKKYGPHSLEEEQISLDLQRLFHRQGIFNPYQGKGGDAIVSYRSQYANAAKPIVRFNPDGMVTLISDNSPGIIATLNRLSQSKLSVSGNAIRLMLPISEFKCALHSEISANILQAFFYSYGYEADKQFKGQPFYTSVYKGDGNKGFRPNVEVVANGIRISLPENTDKQQIAQQITSEFNIDPQKMTIIDSTLQINETNLEQLTHTLMDNAGVRKTAVISENAQGQILAGKLDFSKKKESGFATAGGGSSRPYNPVLAAREEGEDEFGHTIQQDAQLIPLGTTLPNCKADNIFLVPSNKTSDKQQVHIGYKEFQDGSIKYYNFEDFRSIYATDHTKFDRTSVNLYLNFYQRKIQSALTALGVNNVIVQISQKPESIGKIYLKPTIENYNFSTNEKRIITNNTTLMAILQQTLPDSFHLIEKRSPQGKGKFINREVIELNKEINPAFFFRLIERLTAAPQKEKEIDSEVDNNKPISDSEKQINEKIEKDTLRSFPPFHQLISAIDKMSLYGEHLTKNDEQDKGDLVINLAKELLDSVEKLYLKANSSSAILLQQDMDQFKREFKATLHKNDEHLQHHRKIWKPIIANILIALTCVGLFALIANMTYESYKSSKENKMPKFNQLFFFAQTNTEKAAAHIEEELDHLDNIDSLDMK